jgi:hypothetical protein
VNRVFYVKLRGNGGALDHVSYQVIAPTAEKAIAKAKVQSKRDTGEKYELCVELVHHGRAV